MKKARLLLAGIAMFAIAGGAIAAKSKRGEALFCSTTAGVTGTLKTNYTLTNTGTLYSYCTILPNATVSYTRIRFSD
jgi:hypothetical protein